MTRLFDIAFSLAAILLLLPLMLPIMLILKCTGEHDIFYKQTRIGLDGKEFGVFKFATMLRNSPNMAGGVLTQKDDPRVLPFGKFLRKTKINELPQLINILLGEMSFVGPRPQAKQHYEIYSDRVKAAIDKIRPGLTGIGSLVFRDEEKLLDAAQDRNAFYVNVIAPYKGELEIWYSKHRNIWTYFLLIFMTAWSIVKPGTRIYTYFFKGLPQPPNELKAIL